LRSLPRDDSDDWERDELDWLRVLDWLRLPDWLRLVDWERVAVEERLLELLEPRELELTPDRLPDELRDDEETDSRLRTLLGVTFERSDE